MQASSVHEELTELEGAVLTEIGHRGNYTAFRVRRAFELSGSANWRGSAGAVYAAIKRLAGRGLIETRPIDSKRGGNLLALTGRASRIFHQRRIRDIAFPANLGGCLFPKMHAPCVDYTRLDRYHSNDSTENERR